MTINNNKLLKIDLMKVIRFSVKGMRKEQKKTGTKKKTENKKKFRFFYHPVKNPVYFFFVPQNRNGHMIKRAGRVMSHR